MIDEKYYSTTNVESFIKTRDFDNDGITLPDLLLILKKGKLVIVFVTLLFSAIAVMYAISLPNIYRSDVLLSPVTEESGMKLPGQLGGLASLAGVNLGSSGVDKVSLAIEIIKSRAFLARFIEKYDLKLQIMAVKSWDYTDNTLIYDDEIYDVKNTKWVRDVSAPFKPEPSLQETIRVFSKMVNVSNDKVSGMVTISVDFPSPFIAQRWATLIVKEINDEIRSRELEEAHSSISYLNSELKNTNISDMRTMLFSLIEEQTKTIMLANVREEYVLKTIDAAVVPELKIRPQRVLIVFLGFSLGLFLGAVLVLIRYFRMESKGLH